MKWLSYHTRVTELAPLDLSRSLGSGAWGRHSGYDGPPMDLSTHVPPIGQVLCAAAMRFVDFTLVSKEGQVAVRTGLLGLVGFGFCSGWDLMGHQGGQSERQA